MKNTSLSLIVGHPCYPASGKQGIVHDNPMDNATMTEGTRVEPHTGKGIHIAGKTALVTGGSAGIGKAIVEQLHAAGAHVVIVVRNVEQAQTNLGPLAQHIEIIPADLAQNADQERVIAEVRLRYPDLSLLVNNAGVQVNLPPTNIDDSALIEAMRSEIALNLTAPVALSFGLLPVLAVQHEAAIVNISSGLAVAPKRTAPSYCATKAGLSTFSTTLRYRCEDSAPQIKVIDVIMDYVDTAMTRAGTGKKMDPQEAARQVIEGIQRARSTVWIGRTRMLRVVNRLSPALAKRILRNG